MLWRQKGGNAPGPAFHRMEDHQPPRWADPARPQQFHLDQGVKDLTLTYHPNGKRVAAEADPLSDYVRRSVSERDLNPHGCDLRCSSPGRYGETDNRRSDT
jgi:hypothetical protein